MLNIYPTLSLSHFRATAEVLRRTLFGITKDAEEKGLRSFDIFADGSYLYTDKANEEMMAKTQPTLFNEAQAMESGDFLKNLLRNAHRQIPFLQKALGDKDMSLLPEGVVIDRAERIFVDEIKIKGAGLEALWYWRLHCKMKLRPDSKAEPIEVRGARLEIDVTWAGRPLRVYGNILPMFSPQKRKYGNILDLKKTTLSPLLLNQLSPSGYQYYDGGYKPVFDTSEGPLFLTENVSSLKQKGDHLELASKQDAELPRPINVRVPYVVTYPRRYRPIWGDYNTGQLSGIVIFKADADFTPTIAIRNIQEYADTCIKLIKLVWGDFVSPNGGYVKVTEQDTVARLSDYLPAFWTMDPNQVLFLYDDRPGGNAQNLEATIRAANRSDLLGRIAYITCGNGIGNQGAPISHVVLPPRTTTDGPSMAGGYFFIGGQGNEAPHEFGHLCGLTDRYIECVGYDEYDNGKVSEVEIRVFNPNAPNRSESVLLHHDLARYGHPFNTPNPVSRRMTVPLAIPREINTQYQHWDNLMSSNNVGNNNNNNNGFRKALKLATISEHQMQVVFSTYNNEIHQKYPQYANNIENQFELIPFLVDLYLNRVLQNGPGSQIVGGDRNLFLGSRIDGLEPDARTQRGYSAVEFVTDVQIPNVFNLGPLEIFTPRNVLFIGMKLWIGNTMTYDGTVPQTNLDREAGLGTSFIKNRRFFKLDETLIQTNDYGIIGRLTPMGPGRAFKEYLSEYSVKHPRVDKGSLDAATFGLHAFRKPNITESEKQIEELRLSHALKWFVETGTNTRVLVNANNATPI